MKENSENQDNSDKRILVYDDNIEILTMCKIFFKKYQYQVMTMTRCEDVINDVKSFKPHFILMDLWIPEIGGEKAIELLKGNPLTSNIPVVLFSANSDIKEICKRVNADGYIEKPFNLKEFKETIDHHIRISQNK
ncbi:response regulator [Marivirga sp.]|uniref:response regulator n=1 Tax=Marivirga sp. TaxID=2018662 RepID=UPI0025E7BD4B|nr:response regulator [Marivirga sp.]